MLSINTNLSSLIAQNSMKTSTDKLNQAIERMSTGFKINHAKDNAANYSISTNMTTQLNAYNVAADNVAMGMDMVNTASDIISQMQDKGERLRALAIQARNGTFGTQSLSSITAEADAIMSEINRLYSTAEYNGINLFNRKEYELAPEHKALTETVCAKAEYNGFIEDPVTYTEDDINTMLSTGDLVKLDNNVSTFTSGQKYLITDKESLKRLATLVNGGQSGSGATFILGADIDLNGENWTPIGNYSNKFEGNFDGNGHLIKNLTINSPTEDYQGLFGAAGDVSFKNVGIINCKIKVSNIVGTLVGYTSGNSSILNCYATGDVSGQNIVAGLLGTAWDSTSLLNSYTFVNVSGGGAVGGLVGSGNSSISNSYSTGDVTGTSSCVGGLVGSAGSSISNSYSTGNVSGQDKVGGLVGYYSDKVVTLSNSYSKCEVIGNDFVGGLVGYWNSVSYRPTDVELINCSSLSVVNGNNNVASLLNANTSGQFSLTTVNTSFISQENTNPISTTTAFDLTTVMSGILALEKQNVLTLLQVGINGNDDCSMNFDTNFDFDLSSIVGSIETDSALSAIDNFVSLLSEKSTMLGAVQNRLDSALESISVNIENLTSSRSTIRDADIAEVSAEYIQQQILQQAAATLMSTANQSPAMALQLI